MAEPDKGPIFITFGKQGLGIGIEQPGRPWLARTYPELGQLEPHHGGLVLTEVTAYPGHDDRQLDTFAGRQRCRLRRSRQIQGSLRAAETTFGIDHEWQHVRGAGEPPGGAKLTKRLGPLALAIMDKPQGLASRWHPPCPTHCRLGVRLGRFNISVQVGGNHHQMLSNANCVLLAERPQLVLDRPIQLEACHVIWDRGLRQPRLLRRQHRATPLALSICPAPCSTISATRRGI